MPVCWIVVPCFNEASRLPTDLFRDFARANPEVAFLFVDDGSTDGTALVLKELEAVNEEQFHFLTLPTNQGKAEAVRQGLLAALSKGPEMLGYWDADLATPLPAIVDFVELLNQEPTIDLVMGVRVNLLGRSIERSPLRHYVGRVFATLIALGLGIATYDTQCGAKILRVSGGTRGLLSRPFRSTWLFDVELLGRFLSSYQAAGLSPGEHRFYEYPLEVWKDVPGSKVKPLDALWSLLQLTRLYVSELRHLAG